MLTLEKFFSEIQIPVNGTTGYCVQPKETQ